MMKEEDRPVTCKVLLRHHLSYIYLLLQVTGRFSFLIILAIYIYDDDGGGPTCNLY
jgi:hypothetical protein